MPQQETIDILLLTWPNHPKRLEYFKRTLGALRANLSASRHDLKWIVSAGSEPDPAAEWQGGALYDLCDREELTLVWRRRGESLGYAMNCALVASTARWNLLVQDDWELLYPLDLQPGVELMGADKTIDLIRYSWFQHPERGTEFLGPARGSCGFRLVNIDGHWPYGDDPALRRGDFLDKWGPYLEGGPHGTSENDMLGRLIRGRANILASERCCFGHFGEVSAVPARDELRPRAVDR